MIYNGSWIYGEQFAYLLEITCFKLTWIVVRARRLRLLYAPSASYMNHLVGNLEVLMSFVYV